MTYKFNNGYGAWAYGRPTGEVVCDGCRRTIDAGITLIEYAKIYQKEDGPEHIDLCWRCKTKKNKGKVGPNGKGPDC